MFKASKIAFIFVVIALSISVQSVSANITVLQMDRFGKTSEVTMSKENYKEYFKESLKIGQGLITPSLVFNKKLTLQRISIGLTLSGEVGLGPWAIGSGISQRFYFERSKR